MSLYDHVRDEERHQPLNSGTQRHQDQGKGNISARQTSTERRKIRQQMNEALAREKRKLEEREERKAQELKKKLLKRLEEDERKRKQEQLEEELRKAERIVMERRAKDEQLKERDPDAEEITLFGSVGNQPQDLRVRVRRGKIEQGFSGDDQSEGEGTRTSSGERSESTRLRKVGINISETKTIASTPEEWRVLLGEDYGSIACQTEVMSLVQSMHPRDAEPIIAQHRLRCQALLAAEKAAKRRRWLKVKREQRLAVLAIQQDMQNRIQEEKLRQMQRLEEERMTKRKIEMQMYSESLASAERSAKQRLEEKRRESERREAELERMIEEKRISAEEQRKAGSERRKREADEVEDVRREREMRLKQVRERRLEEMRRKEELVQERERISAELRERLERQLTEKLEEKRIREEAMKARREEVKEAQKSQEYERHERREEQRKASEMRRAAHEERRAKMREAALALQIMQSQLVRQALMRAKRAEEDRQAKMRGKVEMEATKHETQEEVLRSLTEERKRLRHESDRRIQSMLAQGEKLCASDTASRLDRRALTEAHLSLRTLRKLETQAKVAGLSARGPRSGGQAGYLIGNRDQRSDSSAWTSSNPSSQSFSRSNGALHHNHNSSSSSSSFPSPDSSSRRQRGSSGVSTNAEPTSPQHDETNNKDNRDALPLFTTKRNKTSAWDEPMQQSLLMATAAFPAFSPFEQQEKSPFINEPSMASITSSQQRPMYFSKFMRELNQNEDMSTTNST